MIWKILAFAAGLAFTDALIFIFMIHAELSTLNAAPPLSEIEQFRARLARRGIRLPEMGGVHLPLLLALASVPVVAGLLLAVVNASRNIALLALLTTGGLALAIYLRVTCKRAKPAPGAAASKPNKE